ncbi:MAG TPA: RIP metalloprotease RseP, partial [Gammaproteobacteria bacterium]|nr:RIP metalloprotease RseP [Gammaproteobacteria bacterium]
AALEQRASRIEVRTPDARLREYRIDFARAGDALAEGGLLKNLGFSPWRPRLEPVLGEVLSGGAAERAGLEPGDRLLAADGQPIADWTAWVDYVRARPEQRIVLEIERAGARRTLELVPQAVREGGKRIGRIGAMVRYPEGLLEQMRVVVRYDPFEAALRGAQKTLDTSLLTLRTLWGMLVGRASVENISGPLSIAQYAGHSAASGLASFLRFLGVVSVSLGVLNLLPVPVLDGGHLLYNLIEAVRRKPLSERAQQAGQQLGILLLLMLMSLAFYNDLSRLLGN